VRKHKYLAPVVEIVQAQQCGLVKYPGKTAIANAITEAIPSLLDTYDIRIEARILPMFFTVLTAPAEPRLFRRAPVVTVRSASALIGRSFPQTNDAIERLVQAGVLKQKTRGKRNRAFEADRIIQAFTELERRLASPVGDARTAPPNRRVPRL
jgi:hypothetical protein